jgi:hypothetical protein
MNLKSAVYALMAAAVAAFPAHAASVNLRFIGQQIIPTGTQVLGTTLGGLSGIDYDVATRSYISISDDRSQVNPARFYTLNLDLTSTRFNAVNFTATQTLKQTDGSPFPALGIDPEAIRFNGRGGFYYTSEGDANALQSPFVREARSDGSFIRDLTLPGYYLPTAIGGIRQNLAFESLTLTPNGTIFTATENALRQDGPAATLNNGSFARLLAFNPTTGNPLAEYVYEVAPINQSPNPLTAFATNGLVELLALSDSRFIGVERSFSVGAPGTGYSVKLFDIDISGATNITDLSSLTGANFTPVRKTLLFDLGTLGIPLDNIEGISFGQRLENGRQSLIIVSDNNFGATQFTQFLAFELSAIPEPSSWAMMIGGFGLIGGTLRRRKRDVGLKRA